MSALDKTHPPDCKVFYGLPLYVEMQYGIVNTGLVPEKKCFNICSQLPSY